MRGEQEEENLRILVGIVILVAALSLTRPHLRRLLSLEESRLTAITGSARPAPGPNAEEHFSPWEDLEQLDIAELRKARRTVEVAMYSFTDRRLAEVINDLAAHHVRVRIYRDQEQYQEEERAARRLHEPSTTQMFRGRPNIQVRIKQGSERNLMHAKEFCVDGQTLREGSANWSRSGLRVQDNNAHYSTDAKNVDRFEKVFETMWARTNNLVVQ